MSGETEKQLQLIDQLENFYKFLEHNITMQGRNIICSCIDEARVCYPNSNCKEEWKELLNHLGSVINDFERDLPEVGELRVEALKKNLDELRKKEQQQP